MTDLQQRYRGPGRAARVISLLVVVGLVGSGVGVLGWSLLFHSSGAEARSMLTAYEIVDEHGAVGSVTITRASQFVEATCRVVAVAEDHAVVGEREFSVVDGPVEQSFEVELRTERRATSVDLLGCTTPDQPRPS